MKELADNIKSVEWQQIIQKSFMVSPAISEVIKTSDRISDSLNGAIKVSELAKSVWDTHNVFKNQSLLSIEAAVQSLSLQAKIAMPQTTIDAISSINRQHEQLFGNLRSITEAINNNQAVFNQINSWQFAISGISGQLAAIAASQKKWNLIDDFEEITEEAVSLNERIFDENGVTKEGLNELKAFFQRIEIKVDKIDADANALFWKLLALLSFILGFMSEARNWLPKPEYATKQEVEIVIKEQFGIYEKKLKENKEFRITSRVCKVMSKPRLKSLVIEKLPIDFEVTVLQVHHKWVYVSYFDPDDNLPQTGWVMKKHLDKP